MKTFTLMVVLFAAGCASTRTHETQLSRRAWLIEARGNGFTSSTEARQAVLRRAAELAVENGFDFFRIDERSDEVDHTLLANPSAPAHIRKPTSTLRVVMLTKGEAMEDGDAVDARMVLAQR